jgi:preprotein translocase subunit Sss1
MSIVSVGLAILGLVGFTAYLAITPRTFKTHVSDDINR